MGQLKVECVPHSQLVQVPCYAVEQVIPKKKEKFVLVAQGGGEPSFVGIAMLVGVYGPDGIYKILSNGDVRIRPLSDCFRVADYVDVKHQWYDYI